MVLIVTYVAGLCLLAADPPRPLQPAVREERGRRSGLVASARSVIALAIAGIAVGRDVGDPGRLDRGGLGVDRALSEFFIGVIVVAIVGNAAEHWVAVLVAIKDKMDLAVNIAIGSSAQIALFVAPVLVFASFFLGPGPMPLVFNGFELGGVLIAVLIANQVTNEGESTWFEGVQLLARLRDPRRSPSSSPEGPLRMAAASSYSARQLRRDPRRGAALHQRGRVGRAPARPGRGSGRQPAGGRRHRDARDADPDRRPDRRRPRAPRTSRSGRSSAPRSCSRRSRWAGRRLRLRLPQAPPAGHRARRRTCRRSTATSLFFMVFFAARRWCSGSARRTAIQDPAGRIVFVARLRRSTSRSTLRGGGDVQEAEERINPLIMAAARRGDRPAARDRDRDPGPGRARARWSAAPTCSSRSCSTFAEDDRRRAARALPGPRAARDRAAREGQQLLLGPRGKGLPRAREHHRRDGLPVDDPGRASASPSPTGSSAATPRFSVALGLAGGLVAYWALRLRDRFELLPVHRSGWRCTRAFIVVVAA